MIDCVSASGQNHLLQFSWYRWLVSGQLVCQAAICLATGPFYLMNAIVMQCRTGSIIMNRAAHFFDWRSRAEIFYGISFDLYRDSHRWHICRSQSDWKRLLESNYFASINNRQTKVVTQADFVERQQRNVLIPHPADTQEIREWQMMGRFHTQAGSRLALFTASIPGFAPMQTRSHRFRLDETLISEKNLQKPLSFW